ncbi:hypothetical protein MMC31_007167, partial [Peltigera leucophlebia]|nr:hypothetical protein [Peltigera leucophlebia]
MPKHINDEVRVSGSEETTPKRARRQQDSFHMRAQRFIITYSQIDEQFDRDTLGPYIKNTFFDHDTLIRSEYILIAVEGHPNTGGYHIHAYIDAGDHFIVNAPTLLDHSGTHPNIKTVRTTPHKVYEYVAKVGDVIFEEGTPPTTPTTPTTPTKVSADTKWSMIIEARSKEEFFKRATEMAPRDTRLHFSSVEAYANWKYRDIPENYVTPGITCNCEDYPQLTDWVQTYIHHTYLGRPKSLVMWGGSRLGKTLWARSLGKHSYFRGLFVLEGFQPTEVKFAIFDELVNGFSTIPNFKPWFKGEQEFVVEDKYMRKQRIIWGKPSIFIGNSDPRE